MRDEGHHGNGSERLVGTARFVGAQAEGVMSWQATAELALSASFSALHPGGFIRRTGPVGTITLLGTEANFRF